MGEINQERIEYGRLYLQCGMAVQSLLGLRTIERPGEHGKGVFRVRLEAGMEGMETAEMVQNTPVVLRERDENGNLKNTPLFSGYPDEISLFSVGGYREAEITVLSGTAMYDRKKKNRVFQTVEQNYGDIAERVVKDTEHGAYIMTVPDEKPGTPFFQYEETDWEFLKRVSSHLELPLVADSCYYHPRFYIGLPRGTVRDIPQGSSYTLLFDGARYYERKGDGTDIAREDFFCYDVATWINLELGERTKMDGKEWSVSRKEMILKGGTVEFHYRLAAPGYSLVSSEQNEDMTGIGLSGSVTETEAEMCGLALDLEPEQGGGQKYPFASETGNLMYCMPQKGERVYLDLGDGTESGAMVSGCIRKNGEECEGMRDPSRKNFHTEYDKRLELHPESMGFAGGQAGSLLFDDTRGAILSSTGSLVVYAKGSIRLESGKIMDMEALSGVFATILKDTTSYMSINERFDYLAVGTWLGGNAYQTYAPFDDAPKEGHFDWLGFFRNIAIGLAVVAVCVVGAAITVATGGAAAMVGAFVGAAIGAGMTTISMSVEDAISGNVRSAEAAILEIGVAAISGAITGALGVKFPKMNKLVAGLIDTVLSTAERGILAAATKDMTFEEWAAYTFDPGTMMVNFFAGVLIDCAVDGCKKLGKRKPELSGGVKTPGKVKKPGKVPKGGIGNDIGYMKNNSDPMRDVLGSGRNSNPKEWNSIIQDLEKSGVEVKYREGSMAYAPGLTDGSPGQLVIDPDASFSALKHEYQHFLDAKAEGFPSFGKQMYYNPKERVIKELRAYMAEIKEADGLGLKEVSEQLFENYRQERDWIIKQYITVGGE